MRPSNKIEIPAVLDDFVSYYRRDGNGAWGSLHIVLDDHNVSNESVEFCIEWAQEKGDVEGERLALILLQMSKTQRGKLGRLVKERK